MTIAKKTLAATLALSLAGAVIPATAQAGDYYGYDSYHYHEHHHYHGSHRGYHRGGDDLGAAVAIGIIGLAAGAIIGSAISEPDPVYVAPQPVYRAPAPVYSAPPVTGQTYRYATGYPRPVTVEPLPVYAGTPEPFTQEWYAYCAQKYRSFDPATGTFQPYNGPRKLCR